MEQKHVGLLQRLRLLNTIIKHLSNILPPYLAKFELIFFTFSAL